MSRPKESVMDIRAKHIVYLKTPAFPGLQYSGRLKEDLRSKVLDKHDHFFSILGRELFVKNHSCLESLRLDHQLPFRGARACGEFTIPAMSLPPSSPRLPSPPP